MKSFNNIFFWKSGQKIKTQGTVENQQKQLTDQNSPGDVGSKMTSKVNYVDNGFYKLFLDNQMFLKTYGHMDNPLAC